MESTGSQYIDTKLSNRFFVNCKVDISFEYTSNDQSSALGFHTLGGYTTRFGFWGSSSISRFNVGYGHYEGENVGIILDNNLSNVVTFETSSADYKMVNASVYVDGSLVKFITDDLRFIAPTDFNTYLFAMNKIYWGNVQYGKVKIKSCVIYDSDKLTPVRDFIPVISEQGIFGLYDVVTNEFYTNQGSGIFNYDINTYSLSGMGTENDPYLITNEEDLAYVSLVSQSNTTFGQDKYFELTNDIVLNDGYFELDDQKNAIYHDGGDGKLYEWIPIKTGNDAVFDGKGNKITGLYINKTNASNLQGLFAEYVYLNKIQNLTLKNEFIKSNKMVFGFAYGVKNLINCKNIDSILISTNNAIGFVYNGNNGKIINCENYANIYASNCFGIISERATHIYNCKNYGNLYATGSSVGIAGSSISKIENCVNEGIISGSRYNAGIIKGKCNTVLNCENYGLIIGTEDAGGIATAVYGDMTISGCKNHGIVKGTRAGAIIGAVHFINESSSLKLINCYAENEGIVVGWPYGGRTNNKLDIVIKNSVFDFSKAQENISYALVGDTAYLAGGVNVIINNVELNLGNKTNKKLLAVGHTNQLKNILIKTETDYSIDSALLIDANGVVVVTNSNGRYYGSDFSAFYVKWKTGYIGLKALDNVGVYMFAIPSEEYLHERGFEKIA